MLTGGKERDRDKETVTGEEEAIRDIVTGEEQARGKEGKERET